MTCLGCPDSSTLVDLQKLDSRLRYLAEFNNAAAQFVGNVDGYISAPSFSDIEGDDADRVVELALHQIADKRLAISGILVSLAPRSAEAAKIIQHEVSVLIRLMGRDRWRGTHDELRIFAFSWERRVYDQAARMFPATPRQSVAQRPLAPVGMRPDVGAPTATDVADEARLDVAQPAHLGPFVGDPLWDTGSSQGRLLSTLLSPDPLAPQGFAIGSVRALPCAAGGCMSGARASRIADNTPPCDSRFQPRSAVTLQPDFLVML
jgi:hypothetical protein